MEEEIESLLYTFPELIHDGRRVSLECVEDAGGGAELLRATLVLTAPPSYPEQPLVVQLIDTRGTSDDDVAAVQARLTAMAEELRGEPALFQLILAAREELAKLADAVRCCICLDPVRGSDAAPFASSSCGHCMHGPCMATFVAHLVAAQAEGEAQQAARRGAKQAISVVETTYRRDTAAHAAANQRLAVAEQAVQQVQDELNKIIKSLKHETNDTQIDTLQKEARDLEKRVDEATKQARAIKRDVGTLGSALRRSQAAFEDAVATHGAAARGDATEMLAQVPVPCPLCRAPLAATQAKLLLDAAIPGKAAKGKGGGIMASAPPRTPSPDTGTSAAGTSGSSTAGWSSAPLPATAGLDDRTCAYVTEFHRKFADVWKRQQESGCFFA